MRMRLKLGAAASALTLAAGLGVVFAGPALATDDIQMCFLTPPSNGAIIVCATSFPDVDATVNSGAYPGGAYWNAPTSGTHQISYDPSSDPQLCMEVNASADDDIRLDDCLARDSEEWSVTTGSITIGSNTLASYRYKSSYGSNLCLTAPSTIGTLYASTCKSGDAYQTWFFLPD
jgi:hypothetical protein